jgi:hypothetical protein
MFDKNGFIDFCKDIKDVKSFYIGEKISIKHIIKILSNVIDINSDGCLIKEGKHSIRIKPGKLVKKTIDATDNMCEYFANITKAYLIQESTTFREISGEDSSKLFHQKDVGGNFTMRYDCMRHENCQEYFDIFRKNPDKIRVLYSFRKGLKTRESVSGFCVLFTINGKTNYDRIYGYNHEDAILLDNFCRKQKYKNLYESFKPIGLKLDNFIFDKYPYIDSLDILTKDGILCNYLYVEKYNKEELVDLHDLSGGNFS